MIRWYTLLAILLCISSTDVFGAPVLVTSSGLWTVTDEDGGFANRYTDARGAVALILPAGSHHFSLEITNKTLAHAAGPIVAIPITFDDGQRFLLSGTAYGDVVQAGIPDSAMKAWTHAFTALSTMTISLPGDAEPNWTIPLAGTTPTVEAMAHEIEVAGINGLPAPWNPASSPAMPDPGPPPVLSFHPDCVPSAPVASNGWYSQDAAAQQQRRCEEAYAQREAEQRAQELANARAQAAAAEQARIEQAAEAERAQAEQAAAAEQARIEQAAEQSPDNHCRDREIARQLISSFNDLDAFKNLDIRAIDIEHLRTARLDPEVKVISCHGSFVLTNGIRLSGTMTFRPNVAGDTIVGWEADR